ncbi:MAG: aminotransferase class IV [Longimicrobiales bacterium]|nr:aminotransferase class IV [Longimicrobiales bacterium]
MSQGSDARRVWVNGELIPWGSATVPLLSHGLSRGSAVFEVFGVHVGPDGPAAFRMDEHLRRLTGSLEMLEMRIPRSMEEIAAAVSEVVAANEMGRGLIKIIAYWGEEAILQLVPDTPLDLAIFAIPDSAELGLDRVRPISACISKWRKLHPETVPVQAKACANYLNGYLARKDARDRGFDVGLMLGTDGFLAEGSIEAVFLVKDGGLITPPGGRVLHSITRLSVLQAAPVVGIPAQEKAVMADALFTADEIFTSHSAIKVSPVARIEDRTLDAPGPVSRRLMQHMDDIIHFRDDRFAHWFQQL